MAGKITIRRIGSMLPMVCLLIFLALAVTTFWLSIVGFPEAAVRYVEKQAAEHGVSLSIGSLSLYPARGLALRAEDVKIYMKERDEVPLLSAHSLSGGLNISHLIMGSVRPSFFMVEDAKLLLPVSKPAGKYLTLDHANIAARFARGNMVQLTSGSFLFQGIPVRVQGSCDMDILASDAAEEKNETSFTMHDLSKWIERYQSIIDQVYMHIEEQHWEQDQLPVLEVRLAIQEEFRVSLRSSIPSLNLGQFHFRDAVVDLQHNRDTITINSLKFRTVNPEASASLLGGYDVRNRRLWFNLNSSSSLLRMVRSASEGALQKYLYKFRHPDDSPPHVVMNGDVCFEADYTLKSAYVRGEVKQKDLRIGNTRVDDAELSFFYDNGNFCIDRMELRFPDGVIQGVAKAQDGSGQAQLLVDLPIKKILTLVQELGDQEVELPEGLQLGERIKLSAQAQLTTPAFRSGRTQWQGFVPNIHVLSAEVKTDLLQYQGCTIEEPSLLVRLSDVKQAKDLNLLSIASSFLRIKARHISASTADDGGVMALSNPNVEFSILGLQCANDSLPRSADEIRADVQIQSADLPGARRFEEGVVQVKLHHPSIDVTKGIESALASGMSLEAQFQRGVAEDVSFGAVSLGFKNGSDGGGPQACAALLASTDVRASVSDMMHGEKPIGMVTLDFALPTETPGKFEFMLTPAEGESNCFLRTLIRRCGEEELELCNIAGELPHAALSIFPRVFNLQIKDVEIPEHISFQGDCLLSMNPWKLQQAAIHINIPRLVRTPWKLRAFMNKRIPISLQAEVNLKTEHGGDTVYAALLKITHETGVFTGKVTGSSAGQVRVVGDNTIRPDIVDQLIDNEETHSIIRDFRFPSHARTKISDINTLVDYSNGIVVDSFCRVELYNAEYLMCAILDTAQGGEQLRKDLGSNPYTLVNHGTCEVVTDVQIGACAADGSKLPDKSVVSINNIVLDYNNSPWLKRRGWSKGPQTSRLLGQSVIIDIEHSYVELREVRGTVYPAYSLGMFYPDLQIYMADVVLPLPAQVHTAQCVFPIDDDCKRPMSGVIKLSAPESAGFRFLGTTIPLEDFSGFVYIANDYVQLDRMNAKSWEGVLDAVIKIGFGGKSASFDGYIKAQCMNLAKIAASYGNKQSYALCNGEIRFRSPTTNLSDFKAYGQLEIDNGDLMSLSIFRPVSELISDLPGYLTRLEQSAVEMLGGGGNNQAEAAKPGFVTRSLSGFFKGLGTVASKTGDGVGKIASNVPGVNHLIAYDLQGAHAKFDISNGHFRTRDMKAQGSNMEVSLNVDINLDTLELKGDLWPSISSLPTILLSPFTFLSDFVIDIDLYGHVNDVKWGIGLDKRLPTQPKSATSASKKKAGAR